MLKLLAASCVMGSVGAASSPEPNPFAAPSPPTCGCSEQLEALEERLRHEFDLRGEPSTLYALECGRA